MATEFREPLGKSDEQRDFEKREKERRKKNQRERGGGEREEREGTRTLFLTFSKEMGEMTEKRRRKRLAPL